MVKELAPHLFEGSGPGCLRLPGGQDDVRQAVQAPKTSTGRPPSAASAGRGAAGTPAGSLSC